MPKYIVKEHSILYKEVEADSREEAEEIALGSLFMWLNRI